MKVLYIFNVSSCKSYSVTYTHICHLNTFTILPRLAYLHKIIVKNNLLLHIKKYYSVICITLSIYVIYNMFLLYVHKAYCFISNLIFFSQTKFFTRLYYTECSLLVKLYIVIFSNICNIKSHYRLNKVTRNSNLLIYFCMHWFLLYACFVNSCDSGHIAIQDVLHYYVFLFHCLVTYLLVLYSYYDSCLFCQTNNVTNTHTSKLPMFYVTSYGFNLYNDEYCNSVDELMFYNVHCLTYSKHILCVYLTNVITNIRPSALTRKCAKTTLYSYRVSTINNRKVSDVFNSGLFFICICNSKSVAVLKSRSQKIVMYLMSRFNIINSTGK